MERLQKVLAKCGIASRRKSEELILAGRVKVNGEVINTLGYKVEASDIIEVDNEEIQKEEKVVYIINKPKYIISSLHDEKGRTCIGDIIESPYRLFPVGRLDFESTGLLIMTNDGDLSHKILHPKFKIPKTYEVTVKGDLKKEYLNALRNGVTLKDGYRTGKAEIKFVSNNKNKNLTNLDITIYEGHNREIRKMFELFHLEVTRLHRTSEANIELGNLKSGEYRRLKIHEVKLLRLYLDGMNV